MTLLTIDKFNKISIGAERFEPIPVAVRPEAFRSRLISGISGSNPTDGKEVRLLGVV
jgi:hypothetical protein